MNIAGLIERDTHGIAHTVAVSGGKDSTAMAIWLAENEPRPYNFVITPTGDELPEMFAHWNKLSVLLGKRLLPITGNTLNKLIDDEKMIPNFNARFCTRKLKLKPYAEFIGAALPAVSYVGLRADELDREGATHGGDFVTKAQSEELVQRYPLRELNWGITDVMNYLEEKQITIPDRTDCARCFFQRLGEWWMLWRDHPEIYADAEKQEATFGHTFRSPQRDTWPAGLKELRQRFEAGDKPEISLKMMEKRKGMCRTCTL